MGEDKRDPYVEAFLRASDDEHNTRQKLKTLVAHQKPELEAATNAADAAKLEAADRRGEMYKQTFGTGLISPAVIDVLAPGHDSTMCKPDDPSAGYERCTRCFLLHASKNEHEFNGVKLSVLVERPNY